MIEPTLVTRLLAVNEEDPLRDLAVEAANALDELTATIATNSVTISTLQVQVTERNSKMESLLNGATIVHV